MRTIPFISLFMLITKLAAQQPSMQVWTEAWHQADSTKLKSIYAEAAYIFPPNKPSVHGNAKILDFMRGGLGKVDVFFEPNQRYIQEELAFEVGVFKDVALGGQKIVGKGKYAVTWIKEIGSWKILCHTWSMPEKE
ncbi:MAG: nuclear transport factor 2 family protein [Bacteroidota bacterium]